MKLVKAIIRSSYLKKAEEALIEAGVKRITVSKVKGYGYEKTFLEGELVPHAKIEIFCEDDQLERILGTIQQTCCTGVSGDGVIAISSVDDMVKIRTGERGRVALE